MTLKRASGSTGCVGSGGGFATVIGVGSGIGVSSAGSMGGFAGAKLEWGQSLDSSIFLFSVRLSEFGYLSQNNGFLYANTL